MESKRTLILIKHAQPVIEPDVAPNRWRLSEKGRRSSVLLGERLGRYGPGLFVSSEEPKAAETARLAADRLGVEYAVFPGLHEHDRTGAPFFETVGEFEGEARSLFERPHEPVWGNETAEQALERFDGAVRAVLRRHAAETLAVVAHGTVVSLFVARYNDVDAYDLWRRLGLPSLCVLSVPGFAMREGAYDLGGEA